MTALLIVLTVVLAAAIVAAVRAVRTDGPSAPPKRFPDWQVGSLPSTPYRVNH